MKDEDRATISGMASQNRWYDLFSRGARDWLRHNEKVREAVREQLPDLVAGADVLSRPGDRTLQVPVRFLEHYRFRLRDQHQGEGVGQGPGKPGDVYRRGQPGGQGDQSGGGGSGGGEYRFMLELKIDDIVDWLWEELKLPDLKPKSTDALTDEAVIPEGWDRRGPRARLDRRRTVKEAIKRRSIQPDRPAFTDDDLRFRQLARRKRPAVNAVVAFVLDVSASMDPGRRKLAKAFFFWAAQGLRRQYGQLDTVFIAHTNEAWEFDEEAFFQVTATGGTVASSAFRLVSEVFADRYPPALYNQYVFYASDGDNFADDRHAAEALLLQLASQVNFMGFVETPQNRFESSRSETGRLFKSLEARNHPVSSFTVHGDSDIWEAIRAFFQQQASSAA
ncbi:MAG: DUF444 family protein [Ectothiorhodospiraceae bacterium]|nr:DUF444 family protein [Ectothiorhodospiraceae bacterium]